MHLQRMKRIEDRKKNNGKKGMRELGFEDWDLFGLLWNEERGGLYRGRGGVQWQ